jgi:uncharacterized Zn finger protein
MKCPNCDSDMEVRAVFPTNRQVIYMNALCLKCGSIYDGRLEKKRSVLDGSEQAKRMQGVSA